MAGDLLILCYHAVSGSWPSPGAIAPEVLERQLRHLLGQGFRPRTLGESRRAPVDERTLVVTFDDAFRSVLEHGFPILERLAIPATLFVPTDFVEAAAPLDWSELASWRGTAHDPELTCMSWMEIQRLDRAGWEIGSHTCSHPKLVDLDRGAAALELSRSREVCEERLQRPCRSLAYPFGLWDDAAAQLAGEAGYEQAVTLGTHLLGGRSRGQPLALSREGIYRTTRWLEFRAATSPLLGRLRGTRLYGNLVAP